VALSELRYLICKNMSEWYGFTIDERLLRALSGRGNRVATRTMQGKSMSAIDPMLKSSLFRNKFYPK